MMSKYINPYTDFGFKWLFGTEKNKAILIDFLNALFDGMEVVKDLEYRQNEHLGAGPEDRHVIFDVYCVTSTGEHIIVEMQNVRQSAFRDRMLFYAAAPIRKQAPKGAWNFELKRVYSIGILNFTLDKADLSVPEGTRAVEQTKSDGEDVTLKYRHVIQLMDIDTKVIFSKTLTFIYVEMPKFSKAENELKTLLDKWLYAIKTMAETECERPVSLTGDAFDQLFEQARYASLDEDEQRIYDRSLMDYWDIFAIEQTHYNEGLEKGKELGLAEGKELGLAEGKELGLAEGKELGLAEGKELGLVEGKELGLAEGKTQGALQMLISLVRKGLISVQDAAVQAGMSEAAFRVAMEL
ncbi:MAG: Rpn family recombination-promoting nuclease/putative transposase [Proteobacteria bacterium]|nr:Rpn family recombination-promoting nuclease/putative transposase [Pseudomonadota bacterium]